MAMKLREQPGEKMHPSKEEKMHFTFSDTIAGYVTTVDQARKSFTLKTAGDREFQVKLTNTTYAELVRNLGETFQDPGVPLESLLAPGRYLFACGIFYLEAAEKCTEYLREHMRAIDADEEVVYWYHAMDVRGSRERKIFASQFGDDYDAIPAYEQIYALAGPVQTFRVTGDPRILRDAELTINLFDKFFRDREKGGYFSHIDPLTFNPRDETLGQDQARKNWNSVGDHALAYLINLWLATGEKKYADFLAYTADTIVEHFQDYEHSPFVQERFHEDWSHDESWSWQQNRAVVGHNLKIAWNLMRIHHLRPGERDTALART